MSHGLTIAQPDAQPDAQPLSLSLGYSPMLALSPDGTRAVYRVLVDGVDDQPALVVRAFDALENAVLYEGDVYDPFFSPGWGLGGL